MRLPFSRKDKYDGDQPVVGIRRALIERGVAEVELDVTPDVVANLYAHLSLLLYEAPNYVEATVTIKPASETVPFIITVRRGGKPTPHDLRKEADAEVEQLRGVLGEVVGQFTQKGHPGRPCLRTPWITVEQVAEWRSVLVDNSADDAA